MVAAGAASATFLVTAQDDLFADGPQRVAITARSASATAPASALVTVADDEVPALSLAISPPRLVEGGAAILTITRNSEVAARTPALRVGLSASPARQLEMPSLVVIPAGASSVRVSLRSVDDRLANGPRQVLVAASATGCKAGSAGLIITDNEAASNGIISGQVLLSPRLAVGVAGITATLRSGSRVLDVASSDRSGSFRFVGLPPGNYTVAVAGVGFAFSPAARSVTLALPSRGAPQAGVSFNALARAVITSLSPGSSATGSVVAISGLNLNGASAVRFGSIAAPFTIVHHRVPDSAPCHCAGWVRERSHHDRHAAGPGDERAELRGCHSSVTCLR